MKPQPSERYYIVGRPSTRFHMLRNLLSAPFIYGVIIPVALLDLAVSLYQAICFPLYRIPKIRRSDYVQFRRVEMEALIWADKLNCHYCSYVNGVLAYAAKIAGQTEQIWCPIKHVPLGNFVAPSHQKDFVIRVKKADLEQYYEQFEKDLQKQEKSAE